MGIITAISQKCVGLKTTVFQIYGPYYNYSTNITTVSQIYGPCYNFLTLNITSFYKYMGQMFHKYLALYLPFY